MKFPAIRGRQRKCRNYTQSLLPEYDICRTSRRRYQHAESQKKAACNNRSTKDRVCGIIQRVPLKGVKAPKVTPVRKPAKELYVITAL